MNMDSVNKWLTLAANIGVIAGIFFLAFEVNQNNKFLKADQATLRADELSKLEAFDRERQLTILASPVLREIYIKSLYRPADMSLEDLWGMTAFMSNRLSSLRRAYEAYHEGVITQSDWQQRLNAAQYYLGTSFGKVYWQNSKVDFESTDGFVATIDEKLATTVSIPDDVFLLNMQKEISKIGL